MANKPTGRNQKLGSWGESVALAYLEGKGYQLVQRNYRTRFGEIDLILKKDDLTVFVEVKTRSGLGFGFPEEAVTANKQAHLLEAIQAYWLNINQEGAWQVDVVAVIGRPGGAAPQIAHFENAIR